ncbi:MAG: ATP-binding protein, partial [Thermomicrobiales bacterium]
MHAQRARWITIVGPGGVGKTRIALELAHETTGEVAFVPLDAVTESEGVLPAIARALGLHATGADISQALSLHLRTRTILLVLDNFEHVTDAAADVAAAISTAGNVLALATSRIPLWIPGERLFELNPFDTDVNTGANVRVPSAAVQLFLDRIPRKPDVIPVDWLDAIAKICRRIDGLPLAIELAAARTRAMSPPALLARLEPMLPVLTQGPRDAPERQQTMTACVAWSYALLSDAEQRVFRRLGVAIGGCTVDAAAAYVAGDDAPPEPA